MFHRVKPEPAQGPYNQAPQTPTPQAQARPLPQQLPQQQPKQELRQEEKRPAPAAQQPEQDKLVQAVTNAPAATQVKENTPKKEEAPTMIDQPKKPEPAAQDNAPRALEIPGSGAYQRPGQPPVRTAGNFPGSYPGYNPHAAAAGAMTSTDRRLIIGRGITMSGEIESCDHLIVEGTVEATLKGASVLDIAESGVFYGTVEIDEATIAGRFEGDIQVKGRLTIRTGGAITGSIAYKELEVEAGATIDGRLSPIGAAHDSKKAKGGRDAGSSKPRKDSSSHDNDGELFASKAAAE
ncbi:MAG: polymer-forming cytoskeletal protein [Alphaproteobacteria bacterium]|jgi:cytoskeletal protein CcmA (bactofilin family)|nr:polymer-forming cytoskeletal protein [Alphaproteobacteria bacterium]